jgi:hypothetical protein
MEDSETANLLMGAFRGEEIQEGEVLGKDLNRGDTREGLRRLLRHSSVKTLGKMVEEAFKTVIYTQKTPDSPLEEFDGGGALFRDFLKKRDDILDIIDGFGYSGQPDAILFDTHRDRLVCVDMQVKHHPRLSLRFFLYGVFLLARQMVPGFEAKDIQKVTVLVLYSGETAGQQHWPKDPRQWRRQYRFREVLNGDSAGAEALDELDALEVIEINFDNFTAQSLEDLDWTPRAKDLLHDVIIVLRDAWKMSKAELDKILRTDKGRKLAQKLEIKHMTDAQRTKIEEQKLKYGPHWLWGHEMEIDMEEMQVQREVDRARIEKVEAERVRIEAERVEAILSLLEMGAPDHMIMKSFHLSKDALEEFKKQIKKNSDE